MIYRDMRTMDGAVANFRVYRLVRLLHNLRVIKDDELIRHEEAMYNFCMAGMDIDWYNYRMSGGSNEIYQF